MTGVYRSGSASSLGALDGVTYQVTGLFGSTDWYGDVPGVPNSAASLGITYNGSNSSACSQTVSIYNWTSGIWSDLDVRSVGPTAVTITAGTPGTPAAYVSGSTGNGTVSVRVRCASSFFFGDFFASGDLLKVTYGA